MPRFKILPVDPSCSPMELVAPNPAGVLPVVHRLECHEADVLREGEYCFSVRHGDNGFWSIFQRQPVMDDRVIPLVD